MSIFCLFPHVFSCERSLNLCSRFRWDYIFSAIKKRRADKGAVLPDRKDVTMTVPFMDAYVRLLIQTCHRCDFWA